MIKEEKVVFLKNANKVLEQLIKNFINESESNKRKQLDHGTYWEEPLIGFASGLTLSSLNIKPLSVPSTLPQRGHLKQP